MKKIIFVFTMLVGMGGIWGGEGMYDVNEKSNIIIENESKEDVTVLSTYEWGEVVIQEVTIDNEILDNVFSHTTKKELEDNPNPYIEQVDEVLTNEFMTKAIINLLTQTKERLGLTNEDFTGLKFILFDGYVYSESMGSEIYAYYLTDKKTIVLPSTTEMYLFWINLNHEFAHFFEVELLTTEGYADYLQLRNIGEFGDKSVYGEKYYGLKNKGVKDRRLHELDFEWKERTTEMFAEDFTFLFSLPYEIHKDEGWLGLEYRGYINTTIADEMDVFEREHYELLLKRQSFEKSIK